MNVTILKSEFWKDLTSELDIDILTELIVENSNEAAILLGVDWGDFNVIVKPNLAHVSTIKGVGGSTYDHELIDITLDPTLPYGLDAFKGFLREAIFHEMNHAIFMKYNPRENRQIYWTIMEGLGVVFDREYANGEHFTGGQSSEKVKLEWMARYLKDEVNYWDVPNDEMVYQVGAWLVDSAVTNSNKNIRELTTMSPDEIYKLADIN